MRPWALDKLHVIDMRPVGGGFAVWDGCLDRFLTIGRTQVWKDREHFYADTDTLANARLYRMLDLPDWTRNAPSNLELARTHETQVL